MRDSELSGEQEVNEQHCRAPVRPKTIANVDGHKVEMGNEDEDVIEAEESERDHQTKCERARAAEKDIEIQKGNNEIADPESVDEPKWDEPKLEEVEEAMSAWQPPELGCHVVYHRDGPSINDARRSDLLRFE